MKARQRSQSMLGSPGFRNSGHAFRFDSRSPRSASPNTCCDDDADDDHADHYADRFFCVIDSLQLKMLRCFKLVQLEESFASLYDIPQDSSPLDMGSAIHLRVPSSFMGSAIR